jgi:DNA-binding MarR family transcriptional regulator
MSEPARSIAAWEALFRTQVAIMRRLSTDFPHDDISFNEYDVLYTVSRAGERGLRLRDLNKNVLLTQPSISRLVDRLASRNLVAKLGDPQDARGTVIRLTDEGQAAFRAVARVHGATIHRVVGDCLEPEELDMLIHLTRKLRANLPAD